MKKRFLSLMLVLAMMVGVFTPLIASAADEVTEKVTLHKLVMSKADLADWDSDKIKEAGYDGSQNTDQLKALLKEGHSAKEVAGVYFAVKNSKGEFVTIKTDTKENAKPDYGSVDSLDATLPKGYELLAGETTANGIEFNTKGLKGVYTIEEIHEKSSYTGESYVDKQGNELVKNTDGTFYKKGDKTKTAVNKDDVITAGTSITDSKAVPVEITLPLVNNGGVVKEAHVYPKNTEEAPKIDKNFLKNNELTAAEKEAADKLKVGADYKNYQEKKATAKAEIGKKIPYEVKTEIPAKSNLAEAKWDDKMTEGLTYNKDLKVTIGGTEITPTAKELVQTDNGFVLRLQGENLALLNGKDAPVTVELKYSANVNKNAIVDIPEANDITFHYGNTPSQGTTPLPTKPNDNGEVTVEKTWGGKDSDWAEGEYAKFKLVDANTGEDVKAEDLDAVDGYKFESEVKLEKGVKTSYTWKGLKKDKSYKAVEIESKTLSDAEYKVNEKGKIEVTDHKSNNPKPLNPTEPKVVTGGKKFVKTNQEGTERLAGAEFYVKNNIKDDKDNGKYLVATKKDEKAVADAKAALDEAVKKYNSLDADKQTDDEKAKVTEAQEAYNKAFKENATAYTWVDAPKEGEADNRVVLTSDGQGRFEITGLEYGDYKLEEKTAPKGFAKLNKDEKQLEFKVEKGSYTTIGDIDYSLKLKQGEIQTKAQKIINKKVTIPQTGGIGTVIFTAIGLAIMASAIIAIKKRQATEAR